MSGFLTILALCPAIFLISAGVTTFIESGYAQKRDKRRYGKSSSRWQIMLEILGIREVK